MALTHQSYFLIQMTDKISYQVLKIQINRNNKINQNLVDVSTIKYLLAHQDVQGVQADRPYPTKQCMEYRYLCDIYHDLMIYSVACAINCSQNGD